MKKNKKILIIGPLKKPITGVTISNDLLKKKFPFNGFEVEEINMSLPFFEENVGRFSLKKLFIFFKYFLSSYKIFKCEIIYITPGQTFFGIMKYAPFIMFSNLFGKKIVIHIHGNLLRDTYDSSNKIKQFFLEKIVKLSTNGIVLSNSLIRNLTPFLKKEKIFSITNFVENRYILNQKNLENKDYSTKKIIYLSNLMTEKGIFYFLEALDILNTKEIKYFCKIAGNIDLKIKKTILKRIKNNPFVEYLEVVRGEEKKQMLNWGNVFVFPSIQIEGLPLSIIEAMASANSIITTSHDALIDVFGIEDLKIIKKKSASAIADAINDLNFNDRKILNNYNKVIDICTEDTYVNNIIQILES